MVADGRKRGFWNIAYVVLGGSLIRYSLPFVIRRQYLIFHWEPGWSEGAWGYESTVGGLALGTFLFLFGLIEFLHSRRRQ
jgi:hypothetical protein